MTPKEREIMALWDDGFSIEAIVRRLGRADYLVRRTISIYHDSGEESADRRAMEAANRCFLEALRAA